MKILIKEIKNKYRIYKISNNSIFGDYALKEKGRWFWKYHTMDGTWKMQWDTLEEVIEFIKDIDPSIFPSFKRPKNEKDFKENLFK